MFSGLVTLTVHCLKCGGALSMETKDQPHESLQKWDCPYCGEHCEWTAGFKITSIVKRVPAAHA